MNFLTKSNYTEAELNILKAAKKEVESKYRLVYLAYCRTKQFESQEEQLEADGNMMDRFEEWYYDQEWDSGLNWEAHEAKLRYWVLNQYEGWGFHRAYRTALRAAEVTPEPVIDNPSYVIYRKGESVLGFGNSVQAAIDNANKWPGMDLAENSNFVDYRDACPTDLVLAECNSEVIETCRVLEPDLALEAIEWSYEEDMMVLTEDRQWQIVTEQEQAREDEDQRAREEAVALQACDTSAYDVAEYKEFRE